MGVPTCEEIEQFAYAYLEGQFEPEQIKKFERHLQGCANCKRFVDRYREMARLERLAQAVPLDADFERRVIDFVIKESDSD
ncbi:zf-HC2 domain-containing protein [Acidobacteria bacterium AH-259-A15]|nr:zf-HC2 domain-containing protein [Acidobacteria bacterium AH-259-A15]